jgi:protein gp37
MAGNMYDWITAPNCNPLAGRCLHECSYCYALNDPKPGMKSKYTGPIRLDEKVLASKVKGGTRFLCSCNDLFAEGVPKEYIAAILDWAEQQTTVTWAIQSKNSSDSLFKDMMDCSPTNFIWGTTMETNRDTSKFSKAPPPIARVVRGLDYVTIEPIMAFDLDQLCGMIWEIKPKFVNIGADSRPAKDRDLPEPSKEEVLALIAELEKFTEVRIKSNLKRIIGGVK